MFHSSPARWLAALPAIAALTAVAQTKSASGDSPPIDPPTLTFRSAFDGYQPYADEKAIPWKQANDTVHRRGGWRAYAKEASEGSTTEGDAPKADAAPHAGRSTPAPPVKKAQP